MDKINLKEEVFGQKRDISKAQIIFVADLFVDDYVGGAELTSEALIEESPFVVAKVKSQDVTLTLMEQCADKHWIFGNFAGLNPQLIPSIIANLHYSVLEYDYKYCRLRSPEKHLAQLGKPCDCHEQITGKLVSAFYHGADTLWWMSEQQKAHYVKLFPFLAEKTSVVLSSVFSKNTLGTIKTLREGMKTAQSDRRSWIVLGSDSWVKGFDDAKRWCETNSKEMEVLWNVPYQHVLAKLSASEGFVYLPAGKDTCPRMVIEAKLLGCKLHLNENVQHASEDWFDTDDLESIEEYLYAAPTLFWNGIRSTMNHKPTISGYTQTRNCIEQNYPWEQSIKSLLAFCDEVVIVDGGSTDGTWERLLEIREIDPRVKPFQVVRDWNDKRFALFNGQQKAEARARCTGDFCWQVDIDEVVHEDDAQKVLNLVKKFPQGVDLVSLPVIEYWGGPEKVRVDVNPWKWRLSRNNPNITHGLPKLHRRYDEDGTMYSIGSDGDDYIYKDTLENVPSVSFYTKEADAARQAAMAGNQRALAAYEQWLNNVTENLPGVYHYSWYDLERKIHTYKNFWSKHWTSLYNQSQEDVPENNKFFDKKWTDVTDEEIKSLALKMKRELGGWIFHHRVDFSKPTPWINIKKSEPKYMSTSEPLFKKG
jgi:glycosyltransferase involved in cell wall biosynthesis